MKALLLVIAWCILLAVAWPLALLLLVLAPLLLVLALAFHVVGVVLGAALAFVKGVLFLPARLLGQR